MKNCLNENPCNQGYKNPCQGIREDEIVIKQYVDECGRKVYPVTTDSAVLLEDGSTLKEVLQNYITYLNNIQEELLNLKGDHSEYDEKFLDIIARIRILEKVLSNPYTFDITSILSRLSVLEAKSDLGCDAERIDECYTLCNLILVAINNINTQIQELFNLIGENCISDFSNPTVLNEKEITSRDSTTSRQILSYGSSDVLVYNVTPGSTINIRVDITNSADWSSDSDYLNAAGKICELYQFYTQPLSTEYEGSQWLIEDVIGEKFETTAKCAYDSESATYVTNDIVVPNNAKCIAVTRQHYVTKSGKTLDCNITITLVNCPEEDEDTCWFEEWIGNLKNTYNTLLKVIDDTVKDVTFAGESIVNSRIATVPPFVAIHGYIKPTDSLSNWTESHYIYKTGYFLDASLRSYNTTNKPKINRGILLPVTKLYDYALYNKNLNLYEDWNTQKGDLLDAHPGMGYLPDSQQLTRGVIWASPTLYDEEVTPHIEKCGSSKNYVVDFYDISDETQYYNLKITFKNLYGSSCRYSLFTRVCSDLTYPDATISNADDGTILGAFNSSLVETSNVYMNYANETTSITLEDIPSNVKTLCVAYHSFGSAVVEKLPKKVPETSISNLVIPSNETVIIKNVNSADANVITTTCEDNEDLSCTSANGNITITNNSNDEVSLSLNVENKYVVIFDSEVIETDPTVTPTPTPMESTPMLTAPRPLTNVTVKYYSDFNDPTLLPITFNLAPRVPFYEIDTLRFMYVDESGWFYEC